MTPQKPMLSYKNYTSLLAGESQLDQIITNKDSTIDYNTNTNV